MADREWMYAGWSRAKAPSNDWIENTNKFLDRAFSMPNLVEGDTIKCPCATCRNYVRQKRFDIEMHLCKFGFKDGYKKWTSRGEGLADSQIEDRNDEGFGETDHMNDMFELGGENSPPIDEEPSASTQAFHRMVFNVDQPIPSQKAKRRLDGYKVRVGPNGNSKELDGNVLYSMEGGLRHGDVPVGNGVVDKEAILVAAKSKHVQTSNAADYQSVVEENDQLRETNEILVEEIGVHSELILRLYAEFGKAPPNDLLNRLANIEARRHQGNGSSHASPSPHDTHNSNDISDNDSNNYNDMYSDDGGCNGMRHGEGLSDMDGEDNGGNQDKE